MAKEAQYDDFAFAYFVLAFLSFALIPTSWAYFKKWKKLFLAKHSGICNCQQCHKKSQTLNEEAKKINIWSILKFSIWIGLWVAFFYLLSLVSAQTPQQSVQFDPYEILGVGIGAGKDEVKKAFRELSKTYHPDKNPHPKAAEKYIQIDKAYKTLTDDAVREKWERYGNPDGPQAFSIGIALPSFLVESKNSALVLSLYVFFLVIVFPIVVLYFWSRQKEMAGNALMKRTMQLFVATIDEKMKFKQLMTIFPAAEEYRLGVRIRSSDDEGVNKIKPLLPIDEPVPKVNKKTQRMIAPYIYKNKILFYAHFTRIHDKVSPTLKQDILVLTSQAPPILAGLVEACVVKQSYPSAHEALLISQMVVQAVWGPQSVPYNSHLLQLPHISVETLQHWKKRASGLKIQQLLKKKEEFLTQDLGFTTAKIQDIENVASLLPTDLEVSFKLIIPGAEEEEEQEQANVDSNEKSEGKETLDEGKAKKGNSLTQRKKAKETPKPDSSAKKEEIVGGTIMAVLGKVSRPSKLKSNPLPLSKAQRHTLGPNRNPFKDTETEPIEAHAPYLPVTKNESWYLFITADGERILNIQKIGSLRDNTEIFVPISAPFKAGLYNVHLHLICDSYLGFDRHETLKLQVHKDIPKELLQPQAQPPPKPQEEDSEEEVDLGEDDSSDSE